MRERHVKLFRSAGAQAVAIPREFELPGEMVVMRREGVRLILEPAPASFAAQPSATPTPEEKG